MGNERLLVVVILLTASADAQIEETDSGDIHVIKEGSYLSISCYKHSLDDANITLSDVNTVPIAIVAFASCPAPSGSFLAPLANLDISLSTLRKLELYDVPSFSQLTSINFEGVGVQELTIGNLVKIEQISPAPDFLKALVNLKVLKIENARLPPMPATTPVEKVTLTLGESLGAWGGCSSLRELTLQTWNVYNVPERWLAHCTRLTKLTVGLQKLSTHDVRKVLEGARSVRELTMQDCGLIELPTSLLVGASRLQQLDLSRNALGTVKLSDLKLESLKELNLEDCNIDVLQGLPATRESELLVDLRHNPVRDVNLQRADYDMLSHNNVSVKLLGVNVTVKCDCQHGWFARALRERRLWVERASCRDGEGELADVNPESILCDRFACAGCDCVHTWQDNFTVALCSSGLAESIPPVPGLVELHAAGNRIEKIDVVDLPDTLRLLDISHNRVSSMDDTVLAVLFSVPARRVRLAGNPLVCACDTRPLIDALHAHRAQVEDYDNITCAVSGVAVRDINSDELCSLLEGQVGLTAGLAAAGVLMGLAAFAGALYCRFENQIKVFLYARGCCLFCLREEEVDADRPYDAFVSFAHSDEQFVVNELLPGLEEQPHAYKLCVHFRDWVVGDFIPAQITRSVEQSRRTIIVLSEKFVESVWGLLEFRTAYMSTIQEGRARIIVILLDNIVHAEGLDPELRGYVRNNTYVRWGDPWFWEKLRFALPHRRPPREPAPTRPLGSTTELCAVTDSTDCTVNDSPGHTGL